MFHLEYSHKTLLATAHAELTIPEEKSPETFGAKTQQSPEFLAVYRGTAISAFLKWLVQASCLPPCLQLNYLFSQFCQDSLKFRDRGFQLNHGFLGKGGWFDNPFNIFSGFLIDFR
jgi:hypothetical protein